MHDPSTAGRIPWDWRHAEFRRGALDMASLSLGVGAWALVTGVAMAKSGLGPWLALMMSFVVYAGSAQLATLPLLATGTPMWVVFAAGFCVNLRFVIFSAQWRPYFAHLRRTDRLLCGYLAGDMSYVLFMKRFPLPEEDVPAQMPYFLGASICNWVIWQALSVVGIVLADVIPTRWGLGFAGTMALLGMTYSLVSDASTRVAAVVAAMAALAAYALPLKLNIVVAIVAAVLCSFWLEKKAPQSWREASP